MFVELTIETNEESFVIVHQHGGNDINCKSRIGNVQLISSVWLFWKPEIHLKKLPHKLFCLVAFIYFLFVCLVSNTEVIPVVEC